MSQIKDIENDFSLLYDIIINDSIAAEHQSMNTYRMMLLQEVANCKDRLRRMDLYKEQGNDISQHVSNNEVAVCHCKHYKNTNCLKYGRGCIGSVCDEWQTDC